MTKNSDVKQLIGKAFVDIADAIQSGQFGQKVKIGLTTLGSEHGIETLLTGAEEAQKSGQSFQVVLIGPSNNSMLETVEAQSEEEAHQKMEQLLDTGYIQACVTMHYNFPIGVATVGRVITPGLGKEMLLATTTGTASPHRTEAMVKNALYGIITAKALGNPEPKVGILNVDGARQVERALEELTSNGYQVNFSDSVRSDGGAIMRGNDLLAGSVDVMVTDTLTGNIMMKVFSSFTTGGSYEASGFGYGPGVGEGYHRNILILSRASGVPVVANAIKYAAQLAQGNLVEVAKAEFAKAKTAKLDDILNNLTKDSRKGQTEEMEVAAPVKEVVTESISGIDIMELE
ncbi:MAG: glycine/sarcosine/betaine reductase complex component C subunit alpha, partial [Bacillota bacterium]|nr:glycine/sarcosine/betaine reductase complex component C subunit alpha [Bacillota bacterium]